MQLSFKQILSLYVVHYYMNCYYRYNFDDEEDPSAFEEELAIMDEMESEMQQDFEGIDSSLTI